MRYINPRFTLHYIVFDGWVVITTVSSDSVVHSYRYVLLYHTVPQASIEENGRKLLPFCARGNFTTTK